MSPRPRFQVVISAICALWSVLWYVDSSDFALAVVTAAVSIVACVPARPFKPTSRRIIWTWVIILVICMAANVGRIIPGKSGGYAGYFLAFYNRTTTASFSIALTALFFRPSPLQCSAVMAGCVPMLMTTILQRTSSSGGSSVQTDQGALIWGTLALFFVCAQIVEMTSPRDASMPRRSFRELATRIIISCTVFVGAFFFEPSVGRGFERLSQTALSWMNSLGERWDSSSGNMLALDSPPDGFGDMTRPLIAVSAKEPPGYLRESVFTIYDGGRWILGKGDAPRELYGTLSGVETLSKFELPGARVSSDKMAKWRYEVLAPWKISGFCLPGGATAFTISDDDDNAPLLSMDGIAAYKSSRIPSFVIIDTIRGGGGVSWPDGGAVSNYTLIPAMLMNAVSNWVAECPGLAASQSDSEAVAAVSAYFNKEFDYGLGTHYGSSKRDPLEDFMEKKRGHCTLFASASALMLRMCGVPVRVVGGYYCEERHPWTKEWIVRERNGHAWCEFLDRADGKWHILDTTPPDGRGLGYGQPGSWSLAFEWIGHYWRGFRTLLQEKNPLLIISDAGTWLAQQFRYLALSPIGIISAIVLMFFFLRKILRREKIGADELLRRKLTEKMRQIERRTASGNQALRRRDNESWADWVLRVKDGMTAPDASDLHETVAEYESLRYRSKIPAGKAASWLSKKQRK